MIGSIGGFAFIMGNAGGLPDTAVLVVRGIGVVAFLAALWFGVIRPAAGRVAAPPPSREAMRVYGISVGAMLVGIPIGSLVINKVLEIPVLTLPWVILVVGAHFVPLDRAFNAPVFSWLGWIMVAIAIIGGGLSLVVGAEATAWAAVCAGFTMLACSALGSGRGAATREA